MKPYQTIPIVECGEPLLPIPLNQFAVPTVHPYIAVGAPYGERSPYSLRQGVLVRLLQAQETLQELHPGWRIFVFDAYRPFAVQHYMVDYSFDEWVRSHHLDPAHLTPEQRQECLEHVHQFWALPSEDPATPPPHSTGAAVDLTLVDASGTEVDMGSPIDELSPRSYPDHFAPPQSDSQGDRYHQHRQLLRQVLVTAGFCQHPKEWWHFSYGDQLWAWQQPSRTSIPAKYGAWSHVGH